MSVNATVDRKVEGCVDNTPLPEKKSYASAEEIFEQRMRQRQNASELLPLSKNESIKFLDLIRPVSQNHNDETRITFFFDPTFTEEINQFAHKQNGNQHTILTAAWMYVLGFYANTDDIIIAAKTLLRAKDNTVDYFPLRLQWDDNSTLLDLVQKIHLQEQSAYRHVTLADIQRDEKDTSHFGYRYLHEHNQEILNEKNNFDLLLDVINGNALECHLSYKNLLYRNEDMHSLVEHFCNVLHTMITHPMQWASTITVLSDYEIKKIQRWNDTSFDYIHKILPPLVNHDPVDDEKVAIIDKGTEIFYGDLHTMTNQVAHYLLTKGFKHNAVIAVYLDASIHQIAVVLALIKSGFCFLPIDTRQPTSRLIKILEDSQPALCILDKKSLESMEPIHAMECIDVQQLFEETRDYPESTPPVNVNEDDLAYVVYTSGTTGVPKGVANTQKGIWNTLYWLAKALRYSDKDRILYKASFSFDLSLTEYLLPLTVGATLVIPEPEVNQDMTLFIKMVKEYQLTSINFIPCFLGTFLNTKGAEACHSLKKIILAGEKSLSSYAKLAKEKLSAKVYNLYGPSEASVFCSYYEYIGDCFTPTVPIGSPMQNMQMWVLNKYQQLLPRCVRGELYIGGIGLAAGYYHNAELTQQKFITTTLLGQKKRLYKTGDQVRYCQDNTLEFIERNDHQVKVRGHRIELSEIEHNLLLHPNIHQAVATTHKTSDGSAILIAYASLKNHAFPLTNHDIERFLQQSLPEYMIPKVWVWLDVLPTQLNGKIDISQLPSPFDNPSNRIVDEIMLTPLQKDLLTVWRKVLGNPEITLDSHFFEIGGDSISAMRIVADLSWQRYQLTAKELFTFPTIRELATQIEGRELSYPENDDSSQAMQNVDAGLLDAVLAEINKKNTQINKNDIVDVYPLTPVQRGILFHHLNNNNFYIEQLVLTVEGQFDPMKCQQIWETLCQRHELLRACYVSLKNDQPYHVILKSCDSPFEYIDWRSEPELIQSAKLETLIKSEKNYHFTMEIPPLFRVKLIQLSNQNYRMIITDHHIISDGWARSILLDEFLHLYTVKSDETSLPPTVSFKSIPLKLNEVNAQKEQCYWENVLRDSPGSSKLSIDKNDFNDYLHGSQIITYQSRLDSNQVNRLKKLAVACKVTFNALLHSAWAVLLQHYSGGHDCQYGTVVSLRSKYPKQQRCYSNHMSAVPVRINVNETFTLNKLFETLQTQFLNSNDHPRIGLCHARNVLNKSANAPLFNYMVVYENYPLYQWTHFKNSDFSFKNVIFNDDTHYPLTLFFIPDQDDLLVEFHYQTHHFSPTDIQYLMQHLMNILLQFDTPDRLLSHIHLYSSEEIDRILYQYNATQENYPDNCTASDYFEKQVLKTPNHIALVCHDESLTYEQLNKRANQLARALINYGVKENDIVGIFQQRGIHYLMTILALHKIGAAYLPLDVNIPVNRFTKIVSQCNDIFVIVEEKLHDQFKNNYKYPHHLVIESLLKQSRLLSSTNLNITKDSTTLAYVLFTSGSTGVPKGVLIEHKALVNRLFAMEKLLKLKKAERWLALSTFTFDTSVLDYYMPWTRGDQVILALEDEIYDPKKLIQLFEQHSITVTQATPTLWQLILDYGWYPKTHNTLICGGEAFLPKLKISLYQACVNHQIDEKELNVWNLYGSTETSIWSIAHRVDLSKNEKDLILAGTPIANTQIYVLNQSLLPVATNIIGELYIGGAGLARSYLNDVELTDSKFVSNPFDRNKKTRLYRTGDLASWYPSGNLQCHGRFDDQIKWHGIRIECNEINSLLEQHYLVNRAITRLIKQNNDTSLVSFIYLNKQALRTTQDFNFHIQQWCSVYDEVYKNTSDRYPATLNTAGWISSFTREPFTHEIMKRWRDDIVQRIFALQPKHILEIGCGTGMLLFPLSEFSQSYTAIDPSTEALDFINEKIRVLPHFSKTKLYLEQAYAHQLSTYQYPIDTVILNSVVQYFPNIDYLLMVLNKVMPHMTSTGQIVIGDVRSYAHTSLYYATYLSGHYNGFTDDTTIKRLIDDLTSQENELLIHPHYFYHLKTLIPQLQSVSIELKQADNDNELSTFRYDVTLHLGEHYVPNILLEWHDFQHEKLNLDDIEQQLKASQTKYFCIANIPNSRFNVYFEQVTMKLGNECTEEIGLDSKSINSNQVCDMTISPYALYSLAKRLEYNIYCTWSKDNLWCFDVVIYNETFSLDQISDAYYHSKYMADDLSKQSMLTNIPISSAVHSEIKKVLFQYLQDNLPQEMQPNELVFMQALQLTSSGKVDKNALVTDYTAPLKFATKITPAKTQTEQKLLSIWQKVLKKDTFGVDDNFFHIGGHSLKAIQLSQYIYDELNVEVPLVRIFEAPTIRQLAMKLNHLCLLTSSVENLV